MLKSPLALLCIFGLLLSSFNLDKIYASAESENSSSAGNDKDGPEYKDGGGEDYDEDEDIDEDISLDDEDETPAAAGPRASARRVKLFQWIPILIY